MNFPSCPVHGGDCRCSEHFHNLSVRYGDLNADLARLRADRDRLAAENRSLKAFHANIREAFVSGRPFDPVSLGLLDPRMEASETSREVARVKALEDLDRAVGEEFECIDLHAFNRYGEIGCRCKVGLIRKAKAALDAIGKEGK